MHKMIIDTHCHLDLYENPELLLRECEVQGITLIAVTNLPSHFEIGLPFFKNSKTVRISLGLHPLFANQHKSEFKTFLKNIDKTSYIGEVGLDFSKEGINTKDIQYASFERILQIVSTKKKILSIHSRKAEKEVLELLIKYNIQNAIFHWYSGGINLIKDICEAGYYFSINPAMLRSDSGQKIISKIPLNKILMESDGPFVQHNNRTIHPSDLKIVSAYIAEKTGIPLTEVEHKMKCNFYDMIHRIM